ncbi:MAG: DAK2 domain-containing protein, partial [Actinobacteria bacterium]|nr:DAK2 domain-containing protein [Actinomycetota bacterium]
DVDGIGGLHRLTGAGTDPVGDDGPTGGHDGGSPLGAGTDLAATLGAACDEVDDDSSFAVVCHRMSAGARRGARAQAGRRLAAFLGGASEVLRNADRIDGARLALALEAGAERVTEADDGTHPGCLLAVISATADGALDASDSARDLVEVLVSAAEAGLVELERGPLVDPGLAERGTVDPAAAGFLLILDALAAFLTGDPLPAPPAQPGPAGSADRRGRRFELRCRVTPPTPDIEAAAHVEAVVFELSEQLSFDRSGRHWDIDVITTLPGSVVEALAGAGALSEMHIGLAEPQR